MNTDQHFTYHIVPHNESAGGGWMLRLMENDIEVGGGAFPATPDMTSAAAHLEATNAGEEWLSSRTQPVVDVDQVAAGLCSAHQGDEVALATAMLIDQSFEIDQLRAAAAPALQALAAQLRRTLCSIQESPRLADVRSLASLAVARIDAAPLFVQTSTPTETDGQVEQELLNMLGREHPFEQRYAGDEGKTRAYERLERAFVIQQPWPVPDQAAIVWRGDLMDMRYDLVHKQAVFDSWKRERAARSAAVVDVLAERRRQVEREGYDHANDDTYVLGELGAYAAFYAMPPAARDWPAEETGYGATWGEAIVPADWASPKPSNRRGELVKAGALILAEIERIDRAAAQPAGIVCDVPPPGWYCTRVRGHDGPCAAHPAGADLADSEGGHHD